MTTFTIRCLCGSSERFASREAMRAWHAEHKRETCAARRSGRTRVTSIPRVRLEGHADAELAAKIATARREYKPIPIASTASSLSSASNGWKRADIDPWGRHLGGRAQWVGGNCLKASIAHLLGAHDIAAVPDNDDLFGNADWFRIYNERLSRIGFRLDEISADRGLDMRNWIAVVDDAGSDHAVAATKRYVAFDPAGDLQGGLPIARLKYGLALVATTKRVPVFSPHRVPAPA